MNIRHALLSSLALLTAVIVQAAEKPNFVFVIADDCTFLDLGTYGGQAHTPNIDRLASEGVLFDRAYCQFALCNPSRTSLLTGMRPDHIGVVGNHVHFRSKHPDVVTLPQHFKNHGYHAQSLGKVFSGRDREEEQDPQSWSVPPLLKGPGWSNYALPENQGHSGKGVAAEMADVPDEGYSDGKLAALAVETLKDLAKREQPFFLAVGFFKPHLPFCAPQKYWDLYDRARIPGPAVSEQLIVCSKDEWCMTPFHPDGRRQKIFQAHLF